MNKRDLLLNNATVEGLGGNQYMVTIGNESKRIDLDGYLVLSDEDFYHLDDLNILRDDMTSPSQSDGDLFWEAAAINEARYSGFNVDQYIEENK